MRDQFAAAHRDITIAVGSRLNANPFELALALVRAGLHVKEIYAVPSPADFFYIRRLAELSPATELYTNLSPSMLNYEETKHPADLALGADACYYHPHAAKVPWNDEIQPFGYQGVYDLFNRMSLALTETGNPAGDKKNVMAGKACNHTSHTSHASNIHHEQEQDQPKEELS